MPDPRPDPNPGWGLTWWLSVAQLVSWGALYYSFSLFITPMMDELGWSKAVVTGAFSLGLLVAALLSIPAGHLIDRGQARRLMTGGSVLAAVLLATWALADGLLLFYLVWAAMGVCLATVLYEPAFAVLAREYGPRYKRAITLMTLVGGFASTVFVPLTQWLIVWLGWRDALLVLAIINLTFCAAVHYRVLPGAPVAAPMSAGPRPRVPAALREAVRKPAFWGLLLCFAGNAFVFSGVAAHIAPLLQEKGMGIAALVLAISLVGPAQVLARIITLGAERWLSARVLGRGTTALLPVALALLYLAGPVGPLIWVFAVSYGMSNGTMTIVRGTSVPEFLGPAGYGAVAGALALAATLAKAAAPFLVSLLWGWRQSYDAAVMALIGCALLSAAAFWWASAASRQAPAGAGGVEPAGTAGRGQRRQA